MRTSTMIILILAVSAVLGQNFRRPNKFLSKLKDFNPKDFIEGVIIGASDSVDNQCIVKSKDIISKVGTDLTALVSDLMQQNWAGVWSDLQKIVLDVMSDDTEDFCHFIALYNKLSSPLELAKAVFNIYTHQKEVEATLQAFVDAFNAGDASLAGKNVGKFLQISFDYHTK